MDKETQSGVSVIVCCYNSASRLPATIKHLAAQQTEDRLEWEVIIVNNSSTDDTVRVAKELWQQYSFAWPPSFNIVDAAKPGLSYARETGIAAAKYDYVIFCDDDNWLDTNYVQKVYDLLCTHAIAALGGCNEGVFEETPPKWFHSFSGSFAIGKQGKSEFEILPKGKYLVGAGLAFKKSVYLSIQHRGFGFFLTDRLGNKVIGGGDVEMSYLFQLNGYDIAFSNQLKLQHYMPASRITREYLGNMWNNYPHSWLVFEAYKAFILPQSNKDSKFLPSHWKRVAVQRVTKLTTHFHKYAMAKLRGNISYFLPYETNLKYQFYLFQHAQEIVRMVQIIHEVKQKAES